MTLGQPDREIQSEGLRMHCLSGSLLPVTARKSAKCQGFNHSLEHIKHVPPNPGAISSTSLILHNLKYGSWAIFSARIKLRKVSCKAITLPTVLSLLF